MCLINQNAQMLAIHDIKTKDNSFSYSWIEKDDENKSLVIVVIVQVIVMLLYSENVC